MKDVDDAEVNDAMDDGGEEEVDAAAAAAAAAARGLAWAFRNRGATGLYRGRDETAGRVVVGAVLWSLERAMFSLSLTWDADAPRPMVKLDEWSDSWTGLRQ